jgi:beta-galactosidase
MSAAGKTGSQILYNAKYLSALIVLSVSLSIAQPRIDSLINGGWKFTRENAVGASAVGYSDDYWENVSLPHTWNARDGQDGGNDYYRGVGWYRQLLTLPPHAKGKTIVLKFDGAATSTQLYVNGKLAGTHKGNYGAFCFDISSFVTFDTPNVIAVKVNNAKDTTVAPLRGDFTIYGGIYRSVHLLILDQLSISPFDNASSGVYIKQESVGSDKADLEVVTVVRNSSAEEKKSRVKITVHDQDGKPVAEKESKLTIAPTSTDNNVQKMTIRSPHLWDGLKDPYLYSVTVEIFEGNNIKDRVLEPLGLRYFNVDTEKGFFLNGKPYRLNGVNRHQDRENMGSAITLKEHQEDYNLIKEIGATAVRLAHYQQAQEFYDLCDKGGMVVWAELALVDEINPSPEFAENCKQQLQELIKQNYNHPSIFFWSIYNELMPDSDREMYSRVVSELNTLAKQLDASRYTTMASRSKYEGDEYINNVTDINGYNVYRGWYEGKPEHFGTWIDTVHQNHPKLRICISEYGAGASIYQHEYPPQKPHTKGPWHPEEWQSVVHELTWLAMAERPFLWGTFVWNMFDFGSDGRSEGDRLGMNDKGLVTYDRKIKKDAFYWYKVNWNSEPLLYITSRRYSPRPVGTTDIKVYSNCDSVQLTVGNVAKGMQASNDKRFVWESVEIKEGKNAISIVGYKNGKRTEDSCEWYGTKEPINNLSKERERLLYK